MQLDTETAKTIMRSAEQSNAIAEEATRRVIDLMQQAIQDRERIAELEAALRELASDDIYDRNGSTWHDVGHLTRGVQAFARSFLST